MKTASRLPFSLSLYLAKKYFLNVVVALAGLTALVMLADSIELLRRLSGRTDVGLWQTFELIILRAPDLMLQILPFALLFGTLACLMRLSRYQELTTLRAGGLSARQFLQPLLAVSLLLGVAAMIGLNPLAAATLKKYERDMSEIFPGSAQGLVTEGGQIWLKQIEANGSRMFIYAPVVLNQGQVLENASIFQFNRAGNLIGRLQARNMTLTPGYWNLAGVQRFEEDGSLTDQPPMQLSTHLTPEALLNGFTSPNTLSVWELGKYIRTLEATGFPTQAHRLHLQRTLALPVLLAAMFILAAPFALHFSRGQSPARLMLAGLSLGLMFYLFTSIIGSYALSGRLVPTVAAWLPTLVAGLAGIAFLLHFREE